MAKEAGVVKSVNGGIARALNDLTGEVRQLSVGDIVYQGEKIVTEGSNSKVTITQTDGKDITLIGKDTLTLDQDSNNNETVADISALQQAILKGTDLNALEETAAGGPQAGGNGGDGVSLSSTSFAEGGHISNINANVGSIDALSLAAGGDNSFGVSGGSAVGAGAIEPALPAGSIKIPLSAYVGESTSSRLLASFYNSIPNGYHVYRHTDGRDYLTPDDPTTPSAFQHKDGWYVSNDGKLAIGQDDASDLAVTDSSRLSNYANSIEGNTDLNVFGGDNRSAIIVDNTKANSVYSGVGGDGVKFLNNVEVKNTHTGTGVDTVNVEAGAEVKNSDINTGKGGDVVNIKGKLGNSTMIDTEDGDDTVNFAGETSGYAAISTGRGKDTFNIESGATFSKHLSVDTGEDDDTVNIKNGANLSWGSIKTGAGNDTVNIDGNMIGNPNHFNEISTGSGDDTININGHVSGESRIKAGEGNNTVYVRGTVDGKARIEAGDIDNEDKHSELYIESGATLSGGSSVSMGGGNDTIYIRQGSTVNGGATISAGYGNDTAYIDENLDTGNISMGGGVDTINFKKGITIKSGVIDFGEGNDTIDINGITFTNGAELRAGVSDQPAWYSDDDDDIINITNSKFEQNSKIDAKIGDDRINIGTGAIIDNSKVIAGYGSDTININAGSKVINGSKIYSGLDNKDGDRSDLDTININGGEITDSEIHTSHSKTTTNINDGILTNAKILGAYGEDKININGGIIKNSEITGGDGDDKININGGNFTETKISTGNGKYMGNGDVVNIAGGTFSKTTVELQGTKNTVNINSGAIFGDQSNNMAEVRPGVSQYQTKIVNYGGEDHVNVNAGAIVKNATFDLNGGSDTITVASGATVEHSQLITGDDVDTLNINGTISGDTHVDLGYGADKLNIGESATISNSDIHTDDGSQGYVDTIKIANNVTLKDWADIKGGGGVDTITAGDNLKLINGAGIHGDWGNNGSAGTGSNDDGDIITIGKNLNMSGGSMISGGGGDDVISIGKNASIQDTSTIDGGAGYDTLKIADDSVNLTKVTNIEKLDLTQGNHNITLSAKDVLDMTDSNNRLRIDGDSGDNLGLASKGWVEDTSANITGYKVYTNTEGVHTVTLEVQDQVHVF
ncbi:retention module-containing protein [Campylobacter concisus]|uniref:retention module-containing protein n=1 Tax=Campylobacter concisus TaxID=199 RepID=UPI001883EA55|nr:retention module-containing protein [Campylobacter concisus]MBE9819094.1 retention module-containing protein [Campylobacter concisus]